MKYITDNQGKIKKLNLSIVIFLVFLVIGSLIFIPKLFLGNNNNEDTSKNAEQINKEVLDNKMIENKLDDKTDKIIKIVNDNINTEIKRYIEMLRKERQKQINTLKNKINESEKIINSKIDRIEELEEDNKKLQEVNNQLEDKINKVEDNYSVLKEDIKYLENQLNSINSDINNLENRPQSNNSIPSNEYVVNNEEKEEKEESTEVIEKEPEEEKIKEPNFFYTGIIEGAKKIALIKIPEESNTLNKEVDSYINGYKLVEISDNYIKVTKSDKEFIINKR